jgi:hypothetical protein
MISRPTPWLGSLRNSQLSSDALGSGCRFWLRQPNKRRAILQETTTSS